MLERCAVCQQNAMAADLDFAKSLPARLAALKPDQQHTAAPPACTCTTLLTATRLLMPQDGGFEYKKAIVDSILILIREIPAAKEAGLAHLCEFIEVRRRLG